MEKNVDTKSSELITREFLEAAIGHKVINFTIEDGTKAGDNFNSVLHSISVETGGGTQHHYLLKCYPSHPTRQKFLNNRNLFYRELSFYTTFVKDLISFQTEVIGLAANQVAPLPIPQCFGGAAVDFSKCGPEAKEKVYSPLDNYILMTDLRKEYGYIMADRKKPLDLDHAKLAFDRLATFHAVSWAFRKRVDWDVEGKYPFFKNDLDAKKTGMWLGLLEENVGKAVEAIQSALGEDGGNLSKAIQDFATKAKPVYESFSAQKVETEMLLDKVLKIPPEEMENEERWRVICHGDAWTNNMLFQYDNVTNKPQNVILVDFPLAKLGCPSLDLACLVYTSTRREFRRNHLQHCLHSYVERFNEICQKMKVDTLPSFSLELLTRKFHRSKLVGLLIAALSLPAELTSTGDDHEQATLLDEVGEGKSFEDLFKQSRSAGPAGVKKGSLFEEWIVELIQDLCDEGVI